MYIVVNCWTFTLGGAVHPISIYESSFMFIGRERGIRIGKSRALSITKDIDATHNFSFTYLTQPLYKWIFPQVQTAQKHISPNHYTGEYFTRAALYLSFHSQSTGVYFKVLRTSPNVLYQTSNLSILNSTEHTPPHQSSRAGGFCPLFPAQLVDNSPLTGPKEVPAWATALPPCSPSHTRVQTSNWIQH